jgi:hypothetical protein
MSSHDFTPFAVLLIVPWGIFAPNNEPRIRLPKHRKVDGPVNTPHPAITQQSSPAETGKRRNRKVLLLTSVGGLVLILIIWVATSSIMAQEPAWTEALERVNVADSTESVRAALGEPDRRQTSEDGTRTSWRYEMDEATVTVVFEEGQVVNVIVK